MIYPRECLIQHNPDERPTRPEMDTYAISPSGHFYIHYDTTDADNGVPPDLTDNDVNKIPDYVDKVGMTADYAHHVLIDMMGYEEEPFDGEGEYDIYITYLSPGLYGWNWSEGNGRSFIVIGNSYEGYGSPANPEQLLQISLSHFYFHAIQRAYIPSFSVDRYFFEMTSTWFEDIIVPDGNDYLADYWIDPLLNDPKATFDNTDRPGFELALFGHYLSSFLDPNGVDDVTNSTIIRDILERIGDTNSSALSAIEYVLDGENYSLTFIEAWTDFMSRNLYNGIDASLYYYSDQALIDPISTVQWLLDDPQLSYGFVLNLDNKSVAIQSYQLGNFNALLDINHSSDEYFGRISIVSTSDNNDIFWGKDTSGIALSANSEIHFVYGSENSASLSVLFNINLGDVNNDGIVNILDIIMVADYAIGEAEFTDDQIQTADINQDGIINILDIFHLINIVLDE